MIWNRKQWLTFGGIVVITAAAVWFGYYKWYLSTTSHIVSGVLKSMDNGRLVISGIHVSDAVSEIPGYSLRNSNQEFAVLVDSNTKLTKTVWLIPYSRESLSKSYTRIDPASIPKEQREGSLTDFKNVGGMPVVVKTANNSINDTTLKATEIEYISYSYNK